MYNNCKLCVTQIFKQQNCLSFLHLVLTVRWKRARGGSRGKWPRRSIELLFDHASIWLGKPWLIWSRMWQKMRRETRKDSASKSAAEKQLGKTWTYCRMGQGNWWQRTWRKQRYLMQPLSQYLPGKMGFRSPRSLRLERKSAARKTYLQWRKSGST